MTTELENKLRTAEIEFSSLQPLKWPIDETVYCVDFQNPEPMKCWSAVRNLFDEMHHWPLLTDSQETLEEFEAQIVDGLPSNYTEEQRRDWAWVKGLPEDWREWVARGEVLSFERWLESEEENQPIEEELEGKWKQHNNLVVDPIAARIKSPLMLLFPVEKSWHIPGLLRYGNWNACPSPDVQVAAMKYWNERYGAELVSLTQDTAEFKCERPPATKEDSIKLAVQHFYYCSDTAPDSILYSASRLKDSTFWSFWWD